MLILIISFVHDEDICLIDQPPCSRLVFILIVTLRHPAVSLVKPMHLKKELGKHP